MKSLKSWYPLVILTTALVAGCKSENEFNVPPPPSVDVVSPVIDHTTVVYVSFPGRMKASSKIEIRSRVKGFLKSSSFQAGEFVNEGQLLYTIEPDEFEAAVAAAEGNVASAEGDLELATVAFKKREAAFNKNRSVAEIDMLAAEADLKAATAAVKIANTQLDDAKRNLSYTQIKAPIEGRTSRTETSIGSLVGATEPTLLTTIVKDDPIHFYFEVDERSILPFLSRRANAPETQTETEADRTQVQLTLSDGSIYPEAGVIDFIDNAADPESGTIRLRAVFPNREGLLAGGLFGRVGIPQPMLEAALVPRESIQRDLSGSFLLLVGQDNQVVRRGIFPTEFTIGSLHVLKPFDPDRQLGVSKDDKIIISNLQRIRPGMAVSPIAKGTVNTP